MAARHLRRHVPSVVEGGEVRQGFAACFGREASGGVALGLVIAGGDHVGHSRSDVLQPVHITVVRALISESNGMVGESIIHVANVAQMPNHVILLIVLKSLHALPCQCCRPSR
jgi:hypothetical protein